MVIIKGKVSNSFQVIGVLAARKKIREETKSEVLLDLDFHEYWGRANIHQGILQYLAKEKPDRARDNDEVIELSVNHVSLKRLHKKCIVIDDGIGAYRKNVIENLRVFHNEYTYINGAKPSVMVVMRMFFVRAVKEAVGLFFCNYFSVFEKSIFNYYKKSFNVGYFSSAINELIPHVGFLDEFESNSVMIAFNPFLSGEGGEEARFSDLNAKVEYVKRNNPESFVYIKKHPMDNFDYQELGVREVKSQAPIELILKHNINRILAFYGESSTSLLSASVIMNIKTYFFEREDHYVANDFWVDKAFNKYCTRIESLKSIS